MFRLGDFYELFFEDAVLAARELEITLTSRNKEKGAAIPMCGVPYHAAEGYIARLIRRAIAWPSATRWKRPRRPRSWSREVTRVVTPGTATDSLAAALAREQLSGGVARATARAPAWLTWMSPPANSASPKWTRRSARRCLEQLGAREVLVPAELPLLAGRRSG
jgi:DNA mismatch repair protein MutS